MDSNEHFKLPSQQAFMTAPFQNLLRESFEISRFLINLKRMIRPKIYILTAHLSIEKDHYR